MAEVKTNPGFLDIFQTEKSHLTKHSSVKKPVYHPVKLTNLTDSFWQTGSIFCHKLLVFLS